MERTSGRKVTTSLKGFKPLAYTKAGLVLYSKGALWTYSDDSLSCYLRLRNASWKDMCRPLQRLFRTEPKSAVCVQGKDLLICWNKKILHADMETKQYRCVFTARDGFSDVLNICPSENGKHIAYWGDYGSNSLREEVRIYGLRADMQVDTVYVFKAGDIRHVHNIIPRRAGGFYILTGDTEETAGIYAADSTFGEVTPVALGRQQYRAVVGFDTEEGLLYATDAVNEPNSIYLLKDGGQLQQLEQINGSCIYGTQYGGGYLFSTTVEPDENDRGPLSYISYKRGKGILSGDVHLLCVDTKLQVRRVAAYKKDILPMKLFQYGSVQFPQGKSDTLWVYPVAVRRMDGTAVRLENEV